jgi:hypothetical protein
MASGGGLDDAAVFPASIDDTEAMDSEDRFG